jgi:alkylation response protein AidB-like acyl-CoA dehydrogenase
MAGITPFAEIFLEDVKIPRRNLVGEADQGWNYVVESLDYERAWAGLFFSAQSRRVLDELVKLILEIGSTTSSRSLATQVTHKLASIAVQVEISRLLAHQACLLLLSGRHATSESAMSKLFSTELTQRVSQVSMRVLGLYGQLDASFSGVPLGGRGLFAYLSSVGNTILAGTSEVERSVIAQRGLGLPK